MPADKKRSSFGSSFFTALKTAGVILLVFLAGAFVFKDSIIKMSAEMVGSSVLGARISVERFSWEIAACKITANNIVIDHPPGYGKGGFVNIPEVFIQYRPKKENGQWHIPVVHIDLKEMTVVKNDEGKLNIDALKVLHPEKKTKTKVPPFLIDELKLNVGQVVYKDFSNKATPKPTILVYNINFKNRVIKDIDSVPELVGAVIIQAVKHTAIQGAGIYAAAAVMGVGFLPGAVLGVVVAKDDAVQDFNKGYAQVFEVCERFLKERGQVTKAEKAKGTIDGKIEGTDIKISVQKVSWFKTRVRVAARKFMLPKKEFAGGVLYQIAEKLL